MISISVSVDVPSLEVGLRFYGAVFGFTKISEPYRGVAVLRTETAGPAALAAIMALWGDL